MGALELGQQDLAACDLVEELAHLEGVSDHWVLRCAW